MHSVILGCASGNWEDIIKENHSGVHVLPFALELSAHRQGHPFSTALVILDQTTFDDLSPDQLILIQSSTILLLLKNSISKKKESHYRRWAKALFFVGKNPKFPLPFEKDRRNFRTLLESLLDHLTISRRLNSYIRDSFSDIVDANLLIQQKKEIEALNKKLEELSQVDFLTNLLNRRAILDAFNHERNRALRTRWRLAQGPYEKIEEVSQEAVENFGERAEGLISDHIGNFSCIMIDVDHFKKVNDTYGHLAGDRVLQELGQILKHRGIFRENDITGRYGGEEFIILLPDTNSVHAQIPAERLRNAIKEIVFHDEKGRPFHVTISMGISEFLPEEIACDKMIQRADRALYYSKEHGRDQICLYRKDLFPD